MDILPGMDTPAGTGRPRRSSGRSTRSGGCCRWCRTPAGTGCCSAPSSTPGSSCSLYWGGSQDDEGTHRVSRPRSSSPCGFGSTCCWLPSPPPPPLRTGLRIGSRLATEEEDAKMKISMGVVKNFMVRLLSTDYFSPHLVPRFFLYPILHCLKTRLCLARGHDYTSTCYIRRIKSDHQNCRGLFCVVASCT